jgi:hypothetical protein
LFYAFYDPYFCKAHCTQSDLQGKLDGAGRNVLVTGCVYRQFDKQQWQALRGQLDQWHSALVKVKTI